VSEGWHGVPFARPLARTREYVEIVRRILARDGPVEYEGEEYRLPVDSDGLGKPLKLMIHPVRERIPIYLGAIGPKAIEQAAEIADGWMPFMFTPDTAAELLRPFEGREVDVARS
jgi:alkanesulfonate monooxygenase SsuD/methylene tetrahydromethanopterin reductase-like flavin-dependent oxidoreductase (luciferase family)